MIDFKALEFYFSKNERQDIPFSLLMPTQTKKEQPVIPKPIPPKQVKSPVPPQPQPRRTKSVQTILPTPPKKQVKKDKFYSEWEQKYKALQAESLLAKTPFNRKALFIVSKEAPKIFVEKISEAINTRLMKTVVVFGVENIERIILKEKPTHIIYEDLITIKTSLPTIIIEPLENVKTDPQKKKALWHNLKDKLKN
ncbi:MAG: hypothetical protein S4CHLAM20_02200 [Chlamydiia bacterium]|nr:hypothetical protein [Chlamydiia bacterium]